MVQIQIETVVDYALDAILSMRLSRTCMVWKYPLKIRSFGIVRKRENEYIQQLIQYNFFVFHYN